MAGARRARENDGSWFDKGLSKVRPVARTRSLLRFSDPTLPIAQSYFLVLSDIDDFKMPTYGVDFVAELDDIVDRYRDTRCAVAKLTRDIEHLLLFTL